MPGILTVADFVAATKEDFASPTTSPFASKMSSCRQTVASIEEVRVVCGRAVVAVLFVAALFVAALRFVINVSLIVFCVLPITVARPGSRWPDQDEEGGQSDSQRHERFVMIVFVW